MLSKSIRLATPALLSFLLAACTSALPWNKSEPATEVNLAFVLEHNLLYLPGANINGAHGHMLFGSASPRTILDPAFFQRIRAPRYELHMSDRNELELTPVVIGLGGVGDAIIGGDVWGRGAVTLDYRAGLLTYQKEGIHPAYMTLFHFDGEPRITIRVDGRDIPAVVDTSVPDTLVMPLDGAPPGRHAVRVLIAGTDFGEVDVARGDVQEARLGNRLLSRFLITIDYGQQVVGIWRDPRIPLNEPPAAPAKARTAAKKR